MTTENNVTVLYHKHRSADNTTWYWIKAGDNRSQYTGQCNANSTIKHCKYQRKRTRIILDGQRLQAGMNLGPKNFEI